jgi:hypothetical protein
MTLGNIADFIRSALAHPALLLTGEFPRLDGSATLHTPGGDTGLLDSLSIFGLPLAMMMVVMTTEFLARARRKLICCRSCPGPYLRCFVFMLVFVAVMDLHYSVWSDKSIIVALGLLAGASDAQGPRHNRAAA